MRGRGAVIAAAPEKAATLALRRSARACGTSSRRRSYRAVLAYINLVAAQDAVRLLEQSAAQQQDLTS